MTLRFKSLTLLINFVWAAVHWILIACSRSPVYSGHRRMLDQDQTIQILKNIKISMFSAQFNPDPTIINAKNSRTQRCWLHATKIRFISTATNI